jgi:Arc/MetJ family transcription regulator
LLVFPFIHKKLANVRTKREAVDGALRKFVQTGQQKKALELLGTGGSRKNRDYKCALDPVCQP